MARRAFCPAKRCGMASSRWSPSIDRKSNTSELQSHHDLVCRLLLEKKKPGNGNRYSTRSKAKTMHLQALKPTRQIQGPADERRLTRRVTASERASIASSV